ncbi:MAG: cation:proton antiporter regulatory subunit, partial [Flavobacteriales bacterium]
KEMELPPQDMEIVTLPVTLGRGKVVGHTIGEAGIRERFGVTVLAIRRDGRYITNVSGHVRILTDDILYLLGTPEGLARLDKTLR